jgi:hypothetical protein
VFGAPLPTWATQDYTLPGRRTTKHATVHLAPLVTRAAQQAVLKDPREFMPALPRICGVAA